MAYPMGELKQGCLRVDFDRRLKLEFHGSGITSNAGLLAYRELDDVLGLTDLGGAALSYLRRGKNTRHPMTRLDWLSWAEWSCRRRAAVALDKLAPSEH